MLTEIGLEVFFKFYLAEHWNCEKSWFIFSYINSYIVHLNSLVCNLAKFYKVLNISDVSGIHSKKMHVFLAHL